MACDICTPLARQVFYPVIIIDSQFSKIEKCEAGLLRYLSYVNSLANASRG